MKAVTRAVVVPRFGPPDVLTTQTLPLPEPGPGQVRLRLAASGVHLVDLLTRSGAPHLFPSPPRFPIIPGWDAAGTVDAVGERVDGWRSGDRAIALVHQIRAGAGTHAEHIVLDARELAPWPEGLDPDQAGALPLDGLTAHQALTVLDVAPGDRLLINGPVGGVGSLALQLAARAGARVAAVVRQRDAARARKFGARWIVDREAPNLASAVRDAVGRSVDAALDVVGGPPAVAALAAVRDGGRFATIVPHAQRDGTPREPTRGIVPREILIEPNPRALAELARLAAAGALRIEVAHVLPLTDAAKAHALLESRVAGRIVLLGPGADGAPVRGREIEFMERRHGEQA